MKPGELRKVPKRDDKTLAKDLLRPPEGLCEAMADDESDVTPMAEPIRRVKMENEKIVNGSVSTEPDEVK